MSFLTRVATFAVLDTCTAVDCVHTGTRVGAGNGSKSERKPFGRSGGADGTGDIQGFRCLRVPDCSRECRHYTTLRPSPVVVCSSS